MKSIVYASTSVLTIITHWLCCLLPIVAAMIGLGGSSTLLNWVLQYRYYLIGLQIVFMSWSFYHLYFQGHTHLKREKVVLWILLVISVVAWAIPHQWLMSQDQQIASQQVQRVFNARKVTLSFQTDKLPQQVEKELENVTGVLQFKPVESGMVSVRYDFRQISKDQLLQEFRRRGVEVAEVQAN
ncbi:MAG: hypothetical protein QM669_09985 [Siphonobacter sp.]